MLAHHTNIRPSIAHPGAVRATIPQKRHDGSVTIGELNAKL